MMLGSRTGAWAKSGGGVPTARDYVQGGLIAMWDGIENAGWGVHDTSATRLYELISGQVDDGVKSTFVANADNMEVAVGSGVVSTPSVFASAVSSAISFGFARIEMVVFINSEQGQIYGNRLKITDGTFGWQYHTGMGGLSMFSSGWVTAVDTSTIDADAVRLAIDIDKINSTIEYHVGSQSSGAKSIVVPASIPSSAYIYGSGSKIYNMRAYSSALTAEEIAHNYAIDKARFGLP